MSFLSEFHTTEKKVESLKGRKWPSWQQWRRLFKVLSTKERFQVLAGALLVTVSFLAWLITEQIFNRKALPDFGGYYSEAVVGQPQFINPLLAPANAPDQDLTVLVYSGLLRLNAEGNFEPDLAERYETSEQGQVYTVWLKENAFWHDGQPVKSDDVVFTVNTVKNPEVKSPLRLNWLGVQMEKLDERTIRFKLENPSISFLNNLTLGILPSHIWSEVSTRNFGLAEPNLNPIGSGPYRFEKLQKDGAGFIRSIDLSANERFYRQRPYIRQFTLKFYDTEREALISWNRGEVKALGNVNTKDLQVFEKETDGQLITVKLPRLFAIFFNQTQSRVLADKKVRSALAYATNKREIVRRLATGSAEAVYSPLPWVESQEAYPFNLEQAQQILEESDWVFDSPTSTVRQKQLASQDSAVPLIIRLAVPDVEELRIVAEVIKNQWAKIGAQVELNFENLNTIQSAVIKPRNYEALIFGISLAAESDPYAFWHSSQKRDPGLNLALYDNSEVDKLLEELRQITELSRRQELLSQADKFIQDDIPAIFLYNPFYTYLVHKQIKGINFETLAAPYLRFADVENWYIETRRVSR